MKKLKKIILSFACLFLLTGCNVYVYNFDNNQVQNTTKEDYSSDTENNTSSVIITNKPNYNGSVNFSSTIPSQHVSWNNVYDKVKSSVVTIRNISNGTSVSTGSGVFFTKDNEDAYIFTNAHVVEGATSIEVLLHNGILVEGKIVGYDKTEDVAVVKIAKRDDYTIATLRHTNTLKIGEEVLAIGSPLGEKYSETATSGIISNLNISLAPQDSEVNLYLIQIDAALNPGNSGGPLFDNGGNLIGINTIKLVTSGNVSNIESFNYAIPISHFYLVADYLLKGNPYFRPFLSITVEDIRSFNFNKRKQYGIEIDHGLFIKIIDKISPLYNKAEQHQIITHIEGIKVYKASDFSVELLKYAPGDTITLTICNGSGANSQNIQITLIQR